LAGDLDGEAGLDLNYGAAKDVQLTAVLPLGFDNPKGFRTTDLTIGGGVIELAAKYKVLHQADNSWMPDVSLFPRVFVPTDHRFGARRVNLFLPAWAEKDFGPWQLLAGRGRFEPDSHRASVDGGGGIWSDPRQRRGPRVHHFRRRDNLQVDGALVGSSVRWADLGRTWRKRAGLLHGAEGGLLTLRTGGITCCRRP
jgi:hypothetical protein